jgi:hypothetical protein
MFQEKSEEESKYKFLSDNDDEEDDDDIEATAFGTTRIPSIESFGRSFQIHSELRQLNNNGMYSNRTSCFQILTVWVRWMFVVILQVVIIFLVMRPGSKGTDDCRLSSSVKEGFVETGGDINGLYETCKSRNAIF